jgi:hypothetical protein
MFQDYYRDQAPDYLGKEFGPQFAQTVQKLASGSWRGPLESAFGYGIGIGLVHRWPAGRIALRVAGAVVAMGGAFFLWKAISGEAV